MRLSGEAVQQATGGIWHGSVPAMIDGVATDSRAFHAGEAFLALRGPNFDGHRFAASVADRAVALIGDAEGVAGWDELENSKLEVADTLKALGDIAHAWRLQLADTCVIAISGSYGKTSLRSILEAGFAGLGLQAAATRANLNNLIGAPQTLMSVSADADVAVIECGISEAGEMARLAAIVAPDVAVLTGITAAHAEGLGGLAGVVREKALLLNGVRSGGWCALGEGVAELLAEHRIAVPASTIAADVRWQLRGRELDLSRAGESANMQLSLPARHWAANIALAATILLRVMSDRGEVVSLADVVAALAGWQPPAGRMHQCEGKNGALILDDCYNANPVSMQAAIDTLRSIDGCRVAVLGDMAELGSDSAAAHAGMDVSGLDRLFLIGTEMRGLAERHPEAVWFESADEAVAALAAETFDASDTVLVKGSRSMRLESVVAALCEKEAADAL